MSNVRQYIHFDIRRMGQEGEVGVVSGPPSVTRQPRLTTADPAGPGRRRHGLH